MSAGSMGYENDASHFVNFGIAWVRKLDEALSHARRLGRASGVDSDSVEIVSVKAGVVDQSSAVRFENVTPINRFILLVADLEALDLRRRRASLRLSTSVARGG